MILSTKRLKKTDRFQSLIKLYDRCYKHSINQEKKQQKYLSKYIFYNSNTGETISPNYTFDTAYKKYIKSIEQKVYAIEQIAKDKKLVPVFITLTLPTKYHPFISLMINNKRKFIDHNPFFEFDTIEQSVKSGYDHLQYIYRTFYKRVKNLTSDLLYIKVVEIHKTLIPHFHILFYIEKNKIKIFRKIFDKIISEFELTQTDFDLLFENTTIKTNVNRASKYLMKYITKQLNNESDYFTARLLDGWKRKFKIRMITMSNLPLSLGDFRLIYHGLNENTKEKLLNEAKEEKVSLYYLLINNIYQLIVKQYDSKKKISVNRYVHDKKFKLFKVTKRHTTASGYSYILNSFTFFIDNELIYKKQNFNKILKGGISNE